MKRTELTETFIMMLNGEKIDLNGLHKKISALPGLTTPSIQSISIGVFKRQLPTETGSGELEALAQIRPNAAIATKHSTGV